MKIQTQQLSFNFEFSNSLVNTLNTHTDSLRETLHIAEVLDFKAASESRMVKKQQQTYLRILDSVRHIG